MMTTALGTGKQVAVFVAIDHLSAICVGLHAAMRDMRFDALEPILQGVPIRFSSRRQGHSLWTSPIRHRQRVAIYQPLLSRRDRRSGIKSSPSFVRIPQGKGCAERFIRRSKENPLCSENLSVHRGKQRARRRFKDEDNEESSWAVVIVAIDALARYFFVGGQSAPSL